VHLHYTAVDVGAASGWHLDGTIAPTEQLSRPVDLGPDSALTSYGRLASSKGPLVLPVLTLLGWCILCVTLSWGLVPRGAQAQGGADEPPTRAATVVTPVVATVIPAEEVVTPLTGMAEVTTGSAQQIGDDPEGSSNPFTGVRGGFIGAGIGFGAFVVVGALVAAARAVLRRVRP